MLPPVAVAVAVAVVVDASSESDVATLELGTRMLPPSDVATLTRMLPPRNSDVATL
jgi:hypothetical protein